MRGRVSAAVACCLLSGGAAAATPLPGHEFPEADSAGATLLYEKCSACHGVPKPGVHVAENWPGVVYRMQLRMQTKGQIPLTREQLAVVIDYLQRHAADRK